MTTPINMNTASLDELKKINGIGDKRAQLIIAKRQEKNGQLTLDDLKLMTEIPNTMWDPLIDTSIITLEPPEISEQDQIQRMTTVIDTFQQEFNSLKKERDNMQVEFERKLTEMAVEIKVKLKNQEHDYEERLGTLTRKHKEEIDRLLEENSTREVNQPVNILIGSPRVDTITKDTNTAEYVKDLFQTLENVHTLARDQLKSTQNTQKRIYDQKNYQTRYNVGDIVYKLNQATKPGQSPKLKSPGKGPYLITKTRPPVLYLIKDRKNETWIHHDRLKLCEDRDLPLWLKRMRNDVMNRLDKADTDAPAEQTLCLESVFTSTQADEASDHLMFPTTVDGTSMGASDLLVSHAFHHASGLNEEDDTVHRPDPLMPDSIMCHDNADASDLLVLQNINDNMHNKERHRKIITYLEDICGTQDDLDQTFLYGIDDQDEDNAKSVAGTLQADSSNKRVKKRPAYLTDYVE